MANLIPRRIRSTVVLGVALLSALLVSALSVALPAPGAAANGIYWTTSTGAIGKADLDGTGINDELVPGASYPKGVAVGDNHIYWATSAGTIARADIDGTNVDKAFITGAGSPSGLQDGVTQGVAVDAGHIYWTNAEAGLIGRADIDGTNVERSFIGDAGYTRSVVVNANHIYWTSASAGTIGSSDGKIGRADIDGTNVERSFIGDAGNPSGVAVDGGHVYWTNPTNANPPETFKIARAKLDGTAVNLSFIDTGSVGGSAAIAVDTSHIYWPENEGIARTNLDGSGYDPDFISEATSRLEGRGMAVDAGHIYWANAGMASTIARADLDGSGIDQSFVGDTGNYGSGYGIAADADHVYWANAFTQDLERANVDGSDRETSFISYFGLQDSELRGVAADGSHIYWTSYSPSAIGRADLDGTGVNQKFIGDPGYLEHVAVDGGHLYWMTTRGDNGDEVVIARANLDGSGVDERFIGLPQSAFTGGVAVDAKHIYWASSLIRNNGVIVDGIGRARLDGTQVDQQFIKFGQGIYADGIEVDDDFIYWNSRDGIGRAGLDGTGANDSFISIPSVYADVRDLAVDGPREFQTSIDSGPRGLTKDNTPTFTFYSNEIGSTFECRVDTASYSDCSSPKAIGPLADGPHRFRVRATSPDDQTDPSPASRKFTVDTVVDGEATAEKAQAQTGDKIVVVAKVKAKEHLEAKATGKVKTRRRDGCLVGRASEPKPCKVGFKLQRVDKSVGAGEKKTLKLRATDAGNRRLVKLVAKGRKAKAKLKITLSDKAGNETITKPKVKLKPAG